MAGRAHNEEQAMGHLAEAERIADRTGESPKVLWMALGGTNVSVHRVSVLAECVVAKGGCRALVHRT